MALAAPRSQRVAGLLKGLISVAAAMPERLNVGDETPGEVVVLEATQAFRTAYPQVGDSLRLEVDQVFGCKFGQVGEVDVHVDAGSKNAKCHAPPTATLGHSSVEAAEHEALVWCDGVEPELLPRWQLNNKGEAL